MRAAAAEPASTGLTVVSRGADDAGGNAVATDEEGVQNNWVRGADAQRCHPLRSPARARLRASRLVRARRCVLCVRADAARACWPPWWGGDCATPLAAAPPGGRERRSGGGNGAAAHAARKLDALALRLRGQAAAAAEAEAAHAAAAASDAANARAHAEAARWGHVLEYAYNHFSSPPTAGSQLYPQVPIQNYAQYGWELIKGFHTQYTPAGFQTQLDASTYYSGDSTNPATCGSFVGALAVFRDGRVEVVW